MIIRVLCDADIRLKGDRVLAWVVKDSAPLCYSMANLLIYFIDHCSHSTGERVSLASLGLVLCTFNQEWAQVEGSEREGLHPHHHPMGGIGDTQRYVARRRSILDSANRLVARLRATNAASFSSTAAAEQGLFPCRVGAAVVRPAAKVDPLVVDAAISLLFEGGTLRPIRDDTDTALSLGLRAGSSLMVVSKQLFDLGMELEGYLEVGKEQKGERASNINGGGRTDLASAAYPLQEEPIGKRGGVTDRLFDSVMSSLYPQSIGHTPTHSSPPPPLASSPQSTKICHQLTQNASQLDPKSENPGGSLCSFPSSAADGGSKLLRFLSRFGFGYVHAALVRIDVNSLHELCHMRTGPLHRILLDAHLQHFSQPKGNELPTIARCAAIYQRLVSRDSRSGSMISTEASSSSLTGRAVKSVSDLLREEGYSEDKVGRAYLLRSLQMSSSASLNNNTTEDSSVVVMTVARYQRTTLGDIQRVMGEEINVAPSQRRHLQTTLEAASSLFKLIATKIVVEAAKDAAITSKHAAIYADMLLPYASLFSTTEASYQPHRTILRELFAGHSGLTLLRVWAQVRLLMDDPQWAGDEEGVDVLTLTDQYNDGDDTLTIPDSLDDDDEAELELRGTALLELANEAVNVLRQEQPHRCIPQVSRIRESLRPLLGGGGRGGHNKNRKLTTPYVGEVVNDDEQPEGGWRGGNRAHRPYIEEYVVRGTPPHATDKSNTSGKQAEGTPQPASAPLSADPRPLAHSWFASVDEPEWMNLHKEVEIRVTPSNNSSYPTHTERSGIPIPKTFHHRGAPITTSNGQLPPPEALVWGEHRLNRKPGNGNDRNDAPIQTRYIHREEEAEESACSSTPSSHYGGGGGERGPSVDVEEVFGVENMVGSVNDGEGGPTNGNNWKGAGGGVAKVPSPTASLKGGREAPVGQYGRGSLFADQKDLLLPSETPPLSFPDHPVVDHAVAEYPHPPPFDPKLEQNTEGAVPPSKKSIPLAQRYFGGGEDSIPPDDNEGDVSAAIASRQSSFRPVQQVESISSVATAYSPLVGLIRPVDSDLSGMVGDVVERGSEGMNGGSHHSLPPPPAKLFRKSVPYRMLDAMVPDDIPRPARRDNGHDQRGVRSSQRERSVALEKSSPLRERSYFQQLPLEMEFLPKSIPSPTITKSTAQTNSGEPPPLSAHRRPSAASRTYSVEDALRELRGSRVNEALLPRSIQR